MAARAAKEQDPPTQIAALEARLAAGELPRLVIVRGDERYFRDEAVRSVVKAASARALEVEKYDAADPDFSLGRLLGDLAAPPMFAAARCIVVRGATALLKKEEGEESALARAIARFLHDPAGLGVIVLDAEGLRADHALAKQAQARGALLTCRKLYDSPPPWDPEPRKVELVQWLVARARQRNIKATLDELVYLSLAIGNDLTRLDEALALIQERAGRSVRETIGWHSGASPFQIVDQIARGDAAQALAGLEALFRHGFSEKDGGRETDKNALQAMLFGALRSKLRQSLAGARLLERGLDLAAVHQELKLPPFARAEFDTRVRSRSVDEWRAFLLDAIALERRTRQGVNIDVNDFSALCLRWRAKPAAKTRR